MKSEARIKREMDRALALARHYGKGCACCSDDGYLMDRFDTVRDALAWVLEEKNAEEALTKGYDKVKVD